MRTSRMVISLALTVVALAGAQPAPAATAIELLRPGWRVLHCGFARGVLYVTYADAGQAAITPAVHNAAIAKACAAAGYALAASAPQRSGAAALPAASMPTTRPAVAAVSNRAQPSFTPLALGSSLSIDARNDSDLSWRCTINFRWTFDDNSAGPRSATTQATLPPRQNNRVAAVSGDYRNIRFVGVPNWFCNPAD